MSMSVTDTTSAPVRLAAARRGEPLRVLILCGDAEGNLGDRAIVQAMCGALRSAAGDRRVAVTVPCASEAGAARAYHAAALPTGARGWPAMVRAARESDLVICGGGGLFQDDDSLVKMPYWAARVALAHGAAAGGVAGVTRVAGVALGIGPLRAGISRQCARAALRRLDPLSARDPLAQRLAMELTGRDVELTPDPALLLEPACDDDATTLLANHSVPLDGRPLIGVAPRRLFPPRLRVVPHRLAYRLRGSDRRQRSANHALAAQLAAALDHLLERCEGHVVFMPSYNVPHEADDALCADVATAMRSPAHSLLRIDEPALYKAVAARLAVMVGGRMHPIILAAGAGTPVAGLAYNPKFHGLFDMLELPGSVMDVVGFVRDGQARQLAAMVATAMAGQPGLDRRAANLGARTRLFIEQLIKSIA
ncbi:MAG: polysaccharide pyruvyl transferase family protein [Phycisphaeraceae bacterium]